MATKHLDALEQLRETTIVDDQVQAQLRKERVAAIALAKKLYPQQVAAGVEFEHNGQTYIVKKTNKKWDYTHVTIDPIFTKFRAAKKSLDEAQEEHDRLMRTIRKQFPHLKPKTYSETINVIRNK
ncbi:MAG: hypothetical protein IKG86_05450 [Paludibacteraceae bacterium]|jgi:hypothetical protein|nr:hypothetical protein [Paludibacteraceae bacterium]